MPSLVEHRGDVLDVLWSLEAVADDYQVFIDKFVLLQFADQVQVVCRGCLQMDIALESLLDDKLELGTLCAVAIVMVTLIADL